MMGQSEMQENIHIRCDEDLKKLVRRAAAFEDQRMSDYIRKQLREAAERDVPDDVQPIN